MSLLGQVAASTGEHKAAWEQLSRTQQTPSWLDLQSKKAKCPLTSVEFALKLKPAKVALVVEERLGAERQEHLIPSVWLSFIFTIPLALMSVSLFRMRTRQPQSSSPQTLMLEEEPATMGTLWMQGWFLSAQIAKRTPQYMGAGSNKGPAPKKDWFEGERGLQKLMKNPPMAANSRVISKAQSADAKVLVIPLIPLPSICLIQLIPTQQSLMLIIFPSSLTNLLCRYPLEQQSLIRFSIVASAVVLNRIDRKVKVEQQESQIVGRCATHVVLALQVIPGPFTQRPEYLLRIVEISDQKLATVQVLLQF